MDDMFECNDEYIPILDDEVDEIIDAEESVMLDDNTVIDSLISEKEIEKYNDDTDYQAYLNKEE